jgi:hypothetical protein
LRGRQQREGDGKGREMEMEMAEGCVLCWGKLKEINNMVVENFAVEVIIHDPPRVSTGQGEAKLSNHINNTRCQSEVIRHTWTAAYAIACG